MPVSHSFSSSKPQGSDPSIVSKNEWNDAHTNTDHYVAGQGGESDTGTNRLIIPGLSASADIRVAGTNDDEFDSTNTNNPPTGWTAMGSISAVDINSTVKSHLYLNHAAQSGTHMQGVYKSIPVSPQYSITTKLNDAHLRADFNQAGLFIGEGTPGKMDATMCTHETGLKFFAKSYTSPTANNNANLGNVAYGHPPAYLRITVYSATDVELFYSFNGLVFCSLVRHNPGFTIGSYGLFVNSENATYPSIGLFDWIRFT